MKWRPEVQGINKPQIPNQGLVTESLSLSELECDLVFESELGFLLVFLYLLGYSYEFVLVFVLVFLSVLGYLLKFQMELVSELWFR